MTEETPALTTCEVDILRTLAGEGDYATRWEGWAAEATAALGVRGLVARQGDSLFATESGLAALAAHQAALAAARAPKESTEERLSRVLDRIAARSEGTDVLAGLVVQARSVASALAGERDAALRLLARVMAERDRLEKAEAAAREDAARERSDAAWYRDAAKDPR